MPEGASRYVMHGVRPEDMATAPEVPARPVLNTADQVRRWRDANGGPCDIIIDTGINRLGLSPAEAASRLLDGLEIDVLMSHLACADEDVAQNEEQRAALLAVAERVPHRRLS